MNYKSAQELVSDMMDNEGIIFIDNYGRRWKYKGYKFYFADLGEEDFTVDKISCLHLFRSVFKS